MGNYSVSTMLMLAPDTVVSVLESSLQLMADIVPALREHADEPAAE